MSSQETRKSTEIDLRQEQSRRVRTFIDLLQKNEETPFLKNLFTWDKSWLLFKNIKRRWIFVFQVWHSKEYLRTSNVRRQYLVLVGQKRNHPLTNHLKRDLLLVDWQRWTVNDKYISTATSIWLNLTSFTLQTKRKDCTEATTEYQVNWSLKNRLLNKVYDDLDDLVVDIKELVSSKISNLIHGIDRFLSKWEAVIEVDGEYATE